MTAPAKANPLRRDGRSVDYEDVDDLIGIASELQSLDEDRLSVEDLRSVASDLDIPDRYVTPAIEELRRRRTTVLALDAATRKRRAIGIAIASGLLALLAILMVMGNGAIGRRLAEVAEKRAQVVNVIERQRATERQWQEAPPSDEKTAELSGAENRVRIERKRYDEAAAAYNAHVASFPASLWAGLFGHPDALPLSNEVDRF